MEMCGGHMAAGSMAPWLMRDERPPLFDLAQVQTNKRSGTKLPEMLGKGSALLWENGDGFHIPIRPCCYPTDKCVK